MEKIEGVEITLFHNEEEVLIDSVDGYVGKLSGGKARLMLTVHNIDILGFDVDGQKNVIIKKNRSRDDSLRRRYRTDVNILKDGEGVPYTSYHENNIRLLRLTKEHLKTWEVAVVSQKGNFFITVQEIYNVSFYRQGKRVVCPQFDRWPQMVELVNKLLESGSGIGVEALPPIETMPTPCHLASVNRSKLAENEGVVSWYNIASGTGAIQTRQGVAKVHWKEIQREGSRLAYLEAGEMVTFKSLRNTEDERTAFKRQAVGVKPIS